MVSIDKMMRIAHRYNIHIRYTQDLHFHLECLARIRHSICRIRHLLLECICDRKSIQYFLVGNCRECEMFCDDLEELSDLVLVCQILEFETLAPHNLEGKAFH